MPFFRSCSVSPMQRSLIWSSLTLGAGRWIAGTDVAVQRPRFGSDLGFGVRASLRISATSLRTSKPRCGVPYLI